MVSRLASALFLLLGGCLVPSVDFGRRIDGLPEAFELASGLEIGKTTLPETLARLGPPSLVLGLGDVDRAYYVCFDSTTIEFNLSVPVPFFRQGGAADMFYLSAIKGRVRMARLEFDRKGVLQRKDLIDHLSRAHGEAGGAIDRNLVGLAVMESYIQDRERAQIGDAAEDDH
jgi:hypothetical protein